MCVFYLKHEYQCYLICAQTLERCLVNVNTFPSGWSVGRGGAVCFSERGVGVLVLLGGVIHIFNTYILYWYDLVSAL